VYRDESDAATTISSGDAPRDNLEFDPLQLKRRLEDDASCELYLLLVVIVADSDLPLIVNSVSWYI
jgi:hypothetical protein